MMNKFHILSCLLFSFVLLPGWVIGQSVYISVIDSLSKEYIENATVLVEFKNGRNRIIERDFKISQSKKLKIDIPKAPINLILDINHLRYGRKIYSLDLQSKEDTSLVIALSPQAYDMPEITVSPQYEKQKTTFEADSFSTVRTLRMRELVTNIPGISYINGTLKYEGQKVQTLLLDSIDIFGDKYGMMIENLPARLIERLEIIENYQENKHLKSFEEGELAINVKTTDGDDLKIGGGGSTAVSQNQILQLSADLTTIYKESVLFLDGNFNKWGAFPHATDFFDAGSFAYPYASFRVIEPEFGVQTRLSPNLPSKYVFGNRYSGGKANFATRLSDDWNGRVSFLVAEDKSHLTNEIAFQQNLRNNKWSYSEDRNYQFKNKIIETVINLHADKKRSSQDLNIHGSLFSGNSIEDVRIQGDLTDTFITESNMNPQLTYAADYQFTHSIDDATVGILRAKGRIVRRNESWNTTSERLALLFSASALDSVNLNRDEKEVEIDYNLIRKRSDARFKFGMEMLWRRINWDLNYFNISQVAKELAEQGIWHNYGSKLYFSYKNYLTGFQRNKIDFKFKLGGFGIRSSAISSQFKFVVPVESNLKYSHFWTPSSKLSISVGYERTVPDPYYFIRENIALPAFTLISGLNELDLIKRSGFNIEFKSSPYLSLWEYKFNGGYNYYWSKVSSQRNIQIENSFSENYFDKAASIDLSGNVKYFFMLMPLSLKLGLDHFERTFYQILNAERTQFNHTKTSLLLMAELDNDNVDISLSGELRRNIFQGQEDQVAISNFDTKTGLELKYLNDSQSWEFSAKGQYINNISTDFDLLLFDFEVSYNFPVGKVGFMVHNLFNQNYIDRQVNEISTSQFTQPLISRYLGLKLNIVI